MLELIANVLVFIFTMQIVQLIAFVIGVNRILSFIQHYGGSK